MQKRLGIFGDSYAEPTTTGRFRYKGWASRLVDHYGADQVDIYAEGGASLNWIFAKWAQEHQNYQQIVFMVTGMHRIDLPISGHGRHWSNAASVAWHRKQEPFKYVTEFDFLDKWFVLMNSPLNKAYENDKFLTTTFYVRQLRPDVIMMPCYSNGMPYTPEYTWNLGMITHKELGQVSWDLRPNHLTQDSNAWVFEHVVNRLNNNFIDWDPNQTKVYTQEEIWSIYGKP
jgi:hypothetical protein